jgi:hypothetical protein
VRSIAAPITIGPSVDVAAVVAAPAAVVAVAAALVAGAGVVAVVAAGAVVPFVVAVLASLPHATAISAVPARNAASDFLRIECSPLLLVRRRTPADQLTS